MSLDKLAEMAGDQTWIESEDELDQEAEAPEDQDDAGEEEEPETDLIEEGEAKEEPEEEEAEEAETDDDSEDDDTVITLDNKELKIPAGTPPEVVTAVKEMERELRRGFNEKTTEVAAERRELPKRIAEAETKAAEQTRNEIQKAQAKLEMLGRVSLPDPSLFKSPQQLQALLDSDQKAYEQARLSNDMIQQAHTQWNQQKSELDAQLTQVDADIKAKAKIADDEAIRNCNEVLSDNGYDRKRLDGVLESFSQNFGVTDPKFYETLRDPHLIMALEAANKYHALQAKKPGIQKKVAKSVKAASRRAPVKQSGLSRDVKGRFEQRRATVSDLAKLIP